MWLLIFQRLATEFLFDIVYFPVWWYTTGAKRALLFCINLLKFGNAQFAPGLWLKNIFVPMFGQIDWQGRLVSFFIRLINVIGRTIALLVWFGIVVLLFLAWFILPVFITAMLVTSFF